MALAIARPRATELAGVFALGRSMWMLLSQVVQGFDEVEHPDDVKIDWASCQDIPADWIEMAERCMCLALAEMAVLYPVNGAFFTYICRFVDPSWGLVGAPDDS